MDRELLSRVMVGLLVLGLSLAGGCASKGAYSSLVSERDVPALAAALEATEAHPNHTVLVPSRGEKDGPEARIAIHKIENPGDRKLLVMIHGVFSNSEAWRFMIGDLVQDHDLWLIDLPGCGLSDKPTPEKMGPGGYSPAALAYRVLEAISTELATRPGDSPIVLVGHSLGGTIAIRMVGDPALREKFSPVITRVDRTILLSPFDVAINKLDPTFQQVATATGLLINVGSAVGYVQARIAEGTLDSVCDPERALREEADTRLKILSDPAMRRATQAMMQQASSWKGRRPDWEMNLTATALYRNVSVPTLIIWGERDEILPCATGYKMAAQMPDAGLVCMPDVMHSPELEKPRQVSTLIRNFVATGKTPRLDDHGSHGSTHD